MHGILKKCQLIRKDAVFNRKLSFGLNIYTYVCNYSMYIVYIIILRMCRKFPMNQLYVQETFCTCFAGV